MSIVGLGSVSDYCSHNLSVPVMVVRPKGDKGAAAAPAAAGDQVRRVPRHGCWLQSFLAQLYFETKCS